MRGKMVHTIALPSLIRNTEIENNLLKITFSEVNISFAVKGANNLHVLGKKRVKKRE